MPARVSRPLPRRKVFDPGGDGFLAVGDLQQARADHTATLLPDGQVLIAGGFDASGQALRDSELFDPATNTFGPGPALSASRAAHVAVAVGETVVLVGGTTDSAALATTDVLRAGRWQPGPRLRTPRVKMGAAALDGAQVFVVGGSTDTEGRTRLASSEVLNLRTGEVTAGPALRTGEYKLDGAVAALPDGRIVVPSGQVLEVFDPALDTFTTVDVTTYDASSFRTVTPVGEDQVLVAGGYDEAIAPTDEAVLVTIPRA